MSVSKEGLKTEHWSSRLGFILAAVGAAVGLGNFWRFPYIAGENGGGAFVLVYMGCILFIALPLAMTEIMIGKRGQMSAVSSARRVALEHGASGVWSAIGWIGMIATFMIVTFYSVIGGIVISYVGEGLTAGFADNAEQAEQVFTGLLADPWTLTLFHTIFMIVTVAIPARGVHKGIERAVDILMPTLFILMLFLLGYAVSEGAFGQAVQFLFTTDFSKITPLVILQAIGQAFFSVGVGMAILLTYGAYLEKDTPVPSSGAIVAFSDTMVAIMAGLIIFPIVFAFGVEPGAGPGLVFVSLPIAFGQMGFGGVVGTIFFLLLLVAAITSSISIVEIVVSYAEEKGVKRPIAAVGAGIVIWLLGLLSVLSFNVMADWRPLGFIPLFADKNWLDTVDFITSNFMLTTGGLLIGLFGGWVVSSDTIRAEFGWTDGLLFTLWRWLMRVVIPVAIGAMIVTAVIG